MNGIFQRLATGPDVPPIDTPAAVDRLYRRHRLRIMLAITGGYAVMYTCRLALSVVKKPLLDHQIFTATELGLIGSGLFYTYAFGKLVNGFLSDHANLKYFFALGVAVSALLNVAMGFSTALVGSVVLWALNGWFQGFGAPSSVVAMAHWFSTPERGRIFGVWSTSHSMGEGLTFVAVAGVVSAWGWRAGFWSPGVLCVLLAVALVILMQDRPETLGLPPVAVWKRQPPPPAVERGTWPEQRAILRRPAIWVLAASSATLYVTRYAINSWGVLYLQEERGFSLVEAGGILSINTFSGIFGAVAYGFLSDKLFAGRRPPANLLFSLLELAGMAMIFLVPTGSTLFLTVAFFVYGFGLTGLLTSLAGVFAVDIVPRRAVGAAMGFIGVFSYLAAAFQENVSGYLIDRGTTVVDGVRRYDFSDVITFWFACSILAALLPAALWRQRARS